MGWLKNLTIFGGLATWYAFTNPSNDKINNKKEYVIPTEIRVVETSLPYEIREKIWSSENLDGTKENRIELEKIVKTDEIDFSKNFYIKTDRYNLIKDEDWLPSRVVGHIMAMPGRLLFLDWNYAWGQDKKRARAALSMLENNKDVKDLTVRLNHNEAIYDMYRMFTQKDLKERNNFFARATLGTSLSLGDELWAELLRGSYYNPLTRTVVCYSNIESTTAHEIGHHQDFQRFESDWEYMLSRLFPPSMLYQEWQASKNATKLLSNDDQWEFNRYLMPAFFTYLLGAYYLSKKTLQKKDHEENGNKKEFDELSEDEKPEIHPLQTLRHFGTLNAGFYVGIGFYNNMYSINFPELLNYGGFATGFVTTCMLSNLALSKVIPYNREE